MVRVIKYFTYKDIERLTSGKNAFGTNIYTMSIRCNYSKNRGSIERGVLNFCYFDWENEMSKISDDVEKKKSILKKIREYKIPGREDINSIPHDDYSAVSIEL